MLLTNNDMQLVRQAVEVQSGLDKELVSRCSPLIHIEAFDEAVRQAFVVLEERLRQILKKERLTGMQMVNYAFSAEGPLAKLLVDNLVEREGLESLLSGAFKLYRNPAAHTIIGYDGAEARGILYLIDLILKRLARLAEIPQADILPDNLKQLIQHIEQSTNAKVANHIRLFVGKCLKAGLTVNSSATQWISFRRQAMIQSQDSRTPKVRQVAVFQLYNSEKEQAIWFWISQYYNSVVGFDSGPVKKELRELGFIPKGTNQDYYLRLTEGIDREFIDRLFSLVQKVTKEFESTLG